MFGTASGAHQSIDATKTITVFGLVDALHNGLIKHRP